MTVIIECPFCGHALSSHSVGRASEFSASYSRCQVPVRVPVPNSPHEAFMSPCNCTGVSPVQREAPVDEAIVAKPAECLNLGCTNPASQTSSFCSVTCEAEMIQLLSQMTKE
jgi:hypothetical protein